MTAEHRADALRDLSGSGHLQPFEPPRRPISSPPTYENISRQIRLPPDTPRRHTTLELQYDEDRSGSSNVKNPRSVFRISEIELPEETASLKSRTSDLSSHAHPWRPSIFRIGPLLGLAALIFAFLQIFASYAVLKASDGAPVEGWKYQPTVYLAILTAISNKALAFAVVQGAVVTFWLRALRGTTLGRLHRDWAFGLHVYKAMMAGRHFNVLALACIGATFVAMDGPLLQRASSVRPMIPGQPVTLSVSVVPEMPAYYSGWYQYFQNLEGPEVIVSDFASAILPVVRDYGSNVPISSNITGCPGTCRTRIRAPALAVDHCEYNVTDVNFYEPLTKAEDQHFNETKQAPPSREVFVTQLSSSNGTVETLDFMTRLSGDQVAKNCAGPVNQTDCFLVSAIAEYEVEVTNEGVLTFVEPPSNPRIVARANNTALTKESIAKYGLQDPGDWFQTTLGGIVNTFNYQFSTRAGLAPPSADGDGIVDLAVNTMSWNLFQHMANFEAWDNENACAPAWTDPRDDAMAAMNELMFRIGVYTATKHNRTYIQSLLDPGLHIDYDTTASVVSHINVFRSDFRYFAGAAAVELLTILLILFTFYGYWDLGRHVSFSPLEIAKAFDAPLLDGFASNSNGRDIEKLEGSLRVQYGVLRGKADTDKAEPGAERIVLADIDRVELPPGKRLSLTEYYDVAKDQTLRYYRLLRSRSRKTT